MNETSEEGSGPWPHWAVPFMAFSVWPHLFLCPVFSLIPFKALAWDSELIFMIALNSIHAFSSSSNSICFLYFFLIMKLAFEFSIKS
jgi:hypothetical protein